MDNASYVQSPVSSCTRATIWRGVRSGPDSNCRTSRRPKTRVFTWLPPTSMASTRLWCFGFILGKTIPQSGRARSELGIIAHAGPDTAAAGYTRQFHMMRRRGGQGAMKRFGLVIFDCDGVLVDSEVITSRVFAGMLNELG